MKELITVASSFVIVVGLALFMYISNQSHSTAVLKTQELNEVVQKNYDELKGEVEALKNHNSEIDSIFHNKKLDK